MKVTSRSPQQMGKGCGTVFFGIFAGIGLMMTIFLAIAVWQNVRTNYWEPTPCTILTSEVEQKDGKYHLKLNYQYAYHGREFTGSRLKGSGNEFDEAADAQRAARRFRGDQRSICYVYPAAPEESVLEHSSPWTLLAILFPLIFVVLGAIGLIAVWRKNSPSERALSDVHGKTKSPATVLRIIGMVFILLGGLITYFLSIRPWLAVRASETWKEIPCTIVSSRVASHSASKGGATYSIDIRYRYSWEDETLLGDRYSFDSSSSSGRNWRQQVVKQYPPGRRTVCYVNPDDPIDAVLVRESNMSGWWGLVPGGFVLAGIALLVSSRKSIARARLDILPFTSLREERRAGLLGSFASGGGPVRLRTSKSPLAGFIFILIFALFWNGVVWGIFLAADVPTGAKVFLGIFALIGALLFAFAVHQFLALFNPRPELQASTDTVRLGDSLVVQFEFTGRLQRIQRLTVTLQGKEVATYRRGTDTVTDQNVFAKTVLFETSICAQMRNGSVTVQIPNDSMHSLNAPNNKIVWLLQLHGEIPRWPDVDQDFTLNVLPHALTQSEAAAE